MKLRIRHVTTYRYRRPVALLPHRLLLVPRSSQDLTILSATVMCRPEADVAWSQDVFGNIVATAAFGLPSRELAISGEFDVEQRAVAWPVFRIDPAAHRHPFRYAPDDTVDLGAMLQPGSDDPHGQLSAWVAGISGDGGNDTLTLLHRLSDCIADTVTYRQREEEGTQPPLLTLERASGSCRDMAALFIEAARRLGFGARAVSGYLYDAAAVRQDGGATHAWAEVFLPGAGWIAFDPTRRRIGSAELIPVAVARCNNQILPVTGSYTGASDDFFMIDVSVRVTAI